jgi:hypothetical protein
MKKRCLLGLVFVGILLIGGALAYRHFWVSLPIGQGLAGPAVPSEPFAKTWTTRQVLWLELATASPPGTA